MPNGDPSSLNPKGVAYYNMMIDKLLENGIEPMVTMFHYDLPQSLSKFGGFTTPLFIEYFYHYADTLFKLFGDRVKKWVTFNEPYDYCVPGYGFGEYPPMVYAPGLGDYICADTTIRAHAAAYHLYQRKYRKEQKGKVGITLSSQFYFSRQPENQEIVDRAMHFTLGWLANPIFGKTGNYPYVMLKNVMINSIREGRAWSRLKPFEGNWLETIKGSADFLGLNYYSSSYAEQADPPNINTPSWGSDAQFYITRDPNWKQAKSTWLYCVPSGLEGILKYIYEMLNQNEYRIILINFRWIRKNYNNIEVYITENGWSDGGQLDDDDRIEYMKVRY